MDSLISQFMDAMPWNKQKFRRLTLTKVLIGCFMLNVFKLFIALLCTRHEGRVKMFKATKQTSLISEITHGNLTSGILNSF